MAAQTITGPGLPAAIWTLVSVAIALTIGRYLIRALVFKKVALDDYTHGIALLALLGFSISTQSYVNHVKHELAVKAGVEPKPADYAAYVVHARQFQTALSLFAWISLWSVKFTFLLFYRMLFDVSERFVQVWWVVALFTFGTFWIPVAGVLTACGHAHDLYNPEACEHNVVYQQQLLEYSSAVQVLTDLIIMVLPLWMIRRTNLPLAQRLGLVLIFSIALVTVALEILRTAKSVQVIQQHISVTSAEYSSTLLYAILEINFSVIISCLPVYRALFGHNTRQREQRKASLAAAAAGGGRKGSWADMLGHRSESLVGGKMGLVVLEGERWLGSRHSGSSPRRDSFAKWTSPERGGGGEGGFFEGIELADSRSEEMVRPSRSMSYC